MENLFDDIAPTPTTRGNCYLRNETFFFLFHFNLCIPFGSFFILYSFVARPGARFAPKAKPKQTPRKNVSASKDENNVHVASSTTSNESEGISPIESHNAVTVAFSIEEPIKSGLSNGESCLKPLFFIIYNF